MKTLLIITLAGSLFSAAGAIDTLYDPIPTRLFGNQCKDICRIADACSFDGTPTAEPCNVGTRRTNCCDYFGLQ
jgi:hypothetical protein